ncbi:MAG: phosphotransferase [Actinomycetota bacterium]|nr:phosphotransferase [Actinomycetota bacterium]
MGIGEDGERLPGGNVGGAWRVGDTVRRTPGPWTPAVHALLEYLGPRLDHVPAVLGYDERGREVLSYLPGHLVDIDTETLTEPQLDSLLAWTRSFHAAVAGFRHPGPWRFFDVGVTTLVAHNDLAPYNVCFDGDALVGVFDWDFAGPSTPLLELAFIAWNCVPLWRDVGAALAARRLQRIAAGYGSIAAIDILQAVPSRIEVMLDGIPPAAAAGDQGMANLISAGEPGRSRAALADLLRRMPSIAARLA